MQIYLTLWTSNGTLTRTRQTSTNTTSVSKSPFGHGWIHARWAPRTERIRQAMSRVICSSVRWEGAFLPSAKLGEVGTCESLVRGISAKVRRNMSNGTASGDKAFGPDGYQDAPPEIAKAIDSAVFVDDNFPSPEEIARAIKRSVSIRLDPDVYEWFKLPGPGYQTRINGVLRAYMQAQKAKGSGNGDVSPTPGKHRSRITMGAKTAKKSSLVRRSVTGKTTVRSKARKSSVRHNKAVKKSRSRRSVRKNTRR